MGRLLAALIFISIPSASTGQALEIDSAQEKTGGVANLKRADFVLHIDRPTNREMHAICRLVFAEGDKEVFRKIRTPTRLEYSALAISCAVRQDPDYPKATFNVSLSKDGKRITSFEGSAASVKLRSQGPWGDREADKCDSWIENCSNAITSYDWIENFIYGWIFLFICLAPLAFFGPLFWRFGEIISNPILRGLILNTVMVSLVVGLMSFLPLATVDGDGVALMMILAPIAWIFLSPFTIFYQRNRKHDHPVLRGLKWAAVIGYGFVFGLPFASLPFVLSV